MKVTVNNQEQENRKAQIMASTEIPIGTQFIRRGRKNKYIETVTDVLKTYNSKGEHVKTRYVAEHEFCGQTVTDRDVVGTTIVMGEIL